MLRQLYSVLLLLAVPFIVLRLYLKSIALPAYRYRIGERFARFDGGPAAHRARAVSGRRLQQALRADCH